MAEEQKMMNLQIRGEEPLSAGAALFSNFVGISRVGTDVQMEFVFVDLNQLAVLVDAMKKGDAPSSQSLTGKTVAKIVMPGVSFIQLKEHIHLIFEALQTAGVGHVSERDIPK